MKKFIKTACLILIAIWGSASSVAAQNRPTKHILVSPAKAARILKKQNVEVLDVRTKAEVEAGHLPNAKNLDFKSEEFSASINTLAKDKPYLIYCRSGVRSAKAAELMKSMGFTTVYEIEGGITAYQQHKQKQKN